jgi:MFS family permease
VATTFNTFMQSSVPDEYRGRVVSCYLTGVMLGMPIGAFVLGRLGDMIGMRETIAFDALAMMAFASVLLLAYSGMRFIDHDVIDDDSERTFASA